MSMYFFCTALQSIHLNHTMKCLAKCSCYWLLSELVTIWFSSPHIKPTYGHIVSHRSPPSHLWKLHLIPVSNYSLLLSPVASQINEEAKWTLPYQLAKWAAQANDMNNSVAASLQQEALRSAGSLPHRWEDLRRISVTEPTATLITLRGLEVWCSLSAPWGRSWISSIDLYQNSWL